MTHLAATRLRRFDAAILIGADRDNLAPTFSRAVFSNQAVRSDLGLSLSNLVAGRLERLVTPLGDGVLEGRPPGRRCAATRPISLARS